MNQEEKELLLKDLCARLPYEPMCEFTDIEDEIVANAKLGYSLRDFVGNKVIIKPYLRSMSSMTEEERNEYIGFKHVEHHEWDGHSTYTEYVEVDEINNYFVWLNEHHFDYRGLIPMGLALEAPEGMYNLKEK